MKEKDILYQNGDLWVCEDKLSEYKRYSIMKDGITHAKEIACTYLGLEKAIARCDYFATIHNKTKQ